MTVSPTAQVRLDSGRGKGRSRDGGSKGKGMGRSGSKGRNGAFSPGTQTQDTSLGVLYELVS